MLGALMSHLCACQAGLALCANGDAESGLKRSRSVHALLTAAGAGPLGDALHAGRRVFGGLHKQGVGADLSTCPLHVDLVCLSWTGQADRGQIGGVALQAQIKMTRTEGISTSRYKR